LISKRISTSASLYIYNCELDNKRGPQYKHFWLIRHGFTFNMLLYSKATGETLLYTFAIARVSFLFESLNICSVNPFPCDAFLFIPTATSLFQHRNGNCWSKSDVFTRESLADPRHVLSDKSCQQYRSRIYWKLGRIPTTLFARCTLAHVMVSNPLYIAI
jgi:hypothetical protein